MNVFSVWWSGLEVIFVERVYLRNFNKTNAKSKNGRLFPIDSASNGKGLCIVDKPLNHTE